MTRVQYVALCVIGAVSFLAYIEARSVAAALRKITTPTAANTSNAFSIL